MVKKKNERVAKKKEWVVKLYTPIKSLSFFRLEFSLLLLPYFVLVSLPAFMLASMSALFSRSGSSVVSLSHHFLLLSYVLDPLLFCYHVVCPLRLDLQVFSCFVMLLFLVAEF